ncbi:unnamed protein product [Periconia digitata]|uniref:1-alkyl-2-acetylglycerophosphocholine esterase n=1 Tax=Periconia digitata TaxID=1303443 RepID=A0A9W4UE62_9PLEO|nr:unnamed protein product [Periconia digitata]
MQKSRHSPITIALAFFAGALLPNAAAFSIQPQLGPYPVSVSNIAIQTSRDDALAPQSGTKRRLMLSILQPQMDTFACHNSSYTPYMPARTASVMKTQEPAGIPLSPIADLDFNALEVEYCALSSSLVSLAEPRLPILLFQPGYQNSRFSYQLNLASIASSGYTVISMDSTFETPIIEFPDGSTVVNNTGISEDGLGPNDSLPVRVADYSSVIDALENGELQVPGLELSSKSTGEEGKIGGIGVFGHSIGGAAALSAASSDPRIAAAIDWDGQIFSSQINISIPVPAFLFGRETPLPGHVEGWEFAWDNLLKGEKVWVAVNGTQHLSFTDLPIVLDVEGLRKEYRENVEAVGGVIAPERQREILWRGSVGWFDSVLKGTGEDLFHNRINDYPDVRFVK